MDSTIVAVYTICDNLLISLGHHKYLLAKIFKRFLNILQKETSKQRIRIRFIAWIHIP